jgi:hypothetical protein
MCVGDVPRCELFNRDISADAAAKPLGAAKTDQPVTWGDIEPK